MILLVLLLLIVLVLTAGEEKSSSDDAVIRAHRYFASDYFNKCWELIDKTDRLPAEDLLMIHYSHASRAHWQEIGTADNWVVGEWQLARVYAILGRAESGMVHAKECLRLCEENEITGFNLGFAYEALARLHYIQNNKVEAEKFIALGKEAAEAVTKKEDRAYLISDLDSIINQQDK